MRYNLFPQIPMHSPMFHTLLRNRQMLALLALPHLDRPIYRPHTINPNQPRNPDKTPRVNDQEHTRARRQHLVTPFRMGFDPGDHLFMRLFRDLVDRFSLFSQELLISLGDLCIPRLRLDSFVFRSNLGLTLTRSHTHKPPLSSPAKTLLSPYPKAT